MPKFSLSLFLAVTLAGCTDPPAGAAPEPLDGAGGKTFDVSVGPRGAMSFSPSTQAIQVGDTIHWTWDSNFHTVTSGANGVADGVFCSDAPNGPSRSACAGGRPDNKGHGFSFQFTKAGAFPYFCVIHGAMMSGTIVVSAPAQDLGLPPDLGAPTDLGPSADLSGDADAGTDASPSVDAALPPHTFQVVVGPQGAMTFSPVTQTIHIGDSVNWSWASNFHTVTSGANAVPDGIFCSDVPSNPDATACAGGNPDNKGHNFAFRFTKAGTFPYFCVIHGAMMSGAVIVQ